MQRLFAISDLHLDSKENWSLITTVCNSRQSRTWHNDWLMIAGDVCQELGRFSRAIELLTDKFARVIWCPGNRELRARPGEQVGELRYNELVQICRSYRVATPEDSYLEWPAAQERLVIVPLFLLYDYGFRPSEIPEEEAVSWANAQGVSTPDEEEIQTIAFQSKPDWCRHRVAQTKSRLEALSSSTRTILVNHFPLRQDRLRLKLGAAFRIWCGTPATDDWHIRYRARIVIHGHLHSPGVDEIDGVRIEEVSLGYPHERVAEPNWRNLFRQVL